MLLAVAGEFPDWIQAIGVIFALVVSAYQLCQQRVDAKDSARRHEQAEKEAAARHNREMVDRRRERLQAHYAQLAEGVERYLSNRSIAEQLDAEVKYFEALAREQHDPQAKQNALTMQAAAMQHRTESRLAMSRAQMAYLAIRFDDTPEFVKRVEEIMNQVVSWRPDSKPAAAELAVSAFRLAEMRSDLLRPKC